MDGGASNLEVAEWATGIAFPCGDGDWAEPKIFAYSGWGGTPSSSGVSSKLLIASLIVEEVDSTFIDV